MMLAGMRVDLEWAADTNVKALILGGSAAAGNVQWTYGFRSFGGLKIQKHLVLEMWI
jgi:hypothetical protein